MPCDPQCPIRQLNSQLITIKEEKIATLWQILDVTEELGRQPMIAPNRRDEVTRSKRQIAQKLLEAIAELMYLTDEIATGCNTCRTN